MTAPLYGPLLRRLRTSVDALVDEVVNDVALAGERREDVAELVRPVVAWTLDALSESESLPESRLEALRLEGARAANGGESLQRLLDRYLSTGWVVWGAATREATEADAAAVAPLGTALLKAGDAAAAAIAGGFGEAERALALRAAGARREFVDELLDLEPGDAEATARIRRRAADFGLDPGATYRVVVAAFPRDIADGSADLAAIAAALAPIQRPLPRRAAARSLDRRMSEPVVASRRGRVVVLVPTDAALPAGLPRAFEALGGQDQTQWLAIAGPPMPGLARLGVAYADALDALIVAQRLGRSGLVESDEVLLERALLADQPMLAAAVAHELGPVLRASRNAAALLETLRVYIESGENLRATARALGIAPRTVAYRLARIEGLLGGPVRGPRLVRIAAALLAARALPTDRIGEISAIGDIGGVPQGQLVRARADSPRPALRDRSRTRRTRGTGT